MISTLAEALAERGYDNLTPVQEAVNDPALANEDLLVSAQTGSGKTVGFGLAIATTLLGDETKMGEPGAPMALVVAPTRELAFQVMRELQWLYAKTGAKVVSCVGGMDMRDERRTLDRGAHIVVGTPGRLRDHIERGSLDMTGLRAVVLDEADEMLDLGFREDLEFMLDAAPEDRRTLMFSATVPADIAKLAQRFQKNAKRVNTVGEARQHTDIAYQAVRVTHSGGEHAIFNLLRFHDAENAIVFANTRAAVAHLTARLANRGFQVVSLSGELSQSERTHALQAMRDGRAKVCVATDVAARGIDLPNLNLVIHADIPTNTEGLLHRSGRTGRAGRKGISALIIPPKAVGKAERLLKWAKITAEWVDPPSADDILRQDEERLMSDPSWDEEPTEAQKAFAEKLMARHTPEAIAMACLRLFQAQHSAPEDIVPVSSAPPEQREQRERKPFGPSAWIRLSVGQNDNAEARWLLPLLLKSDKLEKSDIGAIRVQDDQTFVELTAASRDGFIESLGDSGVVEDGVTAEALAEAPNLPAQRPRGPKPGGKPGGKRFDDGPRKPRGDREYGDKPRKPRSESSDDKPYKPREDRGDWADKPRKPREDRKPREERDETVHTAYKGKPAGKPYGAKSEGKPYAGKSDGKPSGKPYAGKSDGKPGGGKPYAGKPGGKPAGKSFGKPGDKPAGKSFAKPGAKPAGKPTANAADTSKRFVRPGAKPSAKPRAGGNAPPRRPKS